MDDDTKENLNRVLINAITDINTYGCSSLPCELCPLFNSVEGSYEEELCKAIGNM